MCLTPCANTDGQALLWLACAHQAAAAGKLGTRAFRVTAAQQPAHPAGSGPPVWRQHTMVRQVSARYQLA
jgi:hypothetical protein